MTPVSGGRAIRSWLSSISRSNVLPDPCEPRMKIGGAGSDKTQHRRVEVRGSSLSREGHRQVELGEQAAQHVPDAVLAAESESVDVGPPEEHGVGAERECLDDVAAGADAGVEQDRHAV